MSQHDFEIANQGFPAFRSDLNNGLQALASNSAGTTEPTTTYAYQMWYDETTDILKMRNGDDDAWITLAFFDQTNDEWEVRSAVIQAVDSAGVVIKTDDGITRLTINDGGQIDVTNHVNFPDTVKARFGTGNDLEIYHDGTNSIIEDTGDGELQLITNGTKISLQTDGGDILASFNKNGDCSLRYDNGKKLETVTGGVTITGTCTATAFSGDGSGLTGLSTGANTPAFKARLTSDSTIPTTGDVFEKVPFATEVFDTDGDYDPTTNYRFTPSEAGKYFVGATIQFQDTQTFDAAIVEIRKNGSEAFRFNRNGADDNNEYKANTKNSFAAHGIVDMDGSTDYIECWVTSDRNSQGMEGNASKDVTYFYAFKLSGV